MDLRHEGCGHEGGLIMKRLNEKIAFISGGSGAIGQAIANRLIEEGAIVIIGDIRTTESAHPSVHLDVTSESSWANALASIKSQYGRLDVLINNAGVVSPEPQDFENVSLEEWRRVFSINSEGVFLGMREAIKLMKTNEGLSSIVNIGSIAGYYGVNKSSAYGASKASVKSITKQAAISVARLGYRIRINSIHPSYVWTPLVKDRLVLEYGSEEAGKDAVRNMNPLGQLVEPEDIAAAAAFLSSSDAKMMHGSDLVIDGGRLIQ